MESVTVRASPEVGKRLPKHQVVRDQLAQSILRGDFEGRRLPADRDLAEQFGVSYMTMRRAMGELVEADLLERRIGDGTYIRPHSRSRLEQTTLHLICSTYGGTLQRDFLNGGGKMAEARGWKAHPIRLQANHPRPAIRTLEGGDRAVVLIEEPEFCDPLIKALQKAHDRVILIGNRLDHKGVRSVVANDTRAVELALEHLRAHGHERIALIANYPESANEAVQIAAWKRVIGDVASEGRLIATRTPRFECSTHFAYDQMMNWLKSSTAAPDTTALLCLGDELANGALAALRDAGRPVPDQMSLINLSASALMRFAHPPVTCVNVNLQAHIAHAIHWLDEASNGETNGAFVHFIEPQLVARESVTIPYR